MYNQMISITIIKIIWVPVGLQAYKWCRVVYREVAASNFQQLFENMDETYGRQVKLIKVFPSVLREYNKRQNSSAQTTT
jgi:hypothetical protein